MRCDFAAWRPITANYRAHGMSRNIRGFVPHVQVGNGSLHDFFSNPATQASAHFWISKTGTLEQYLDTDDMAWAEAAGNPYFWSCEFEGQVDEPMTPQQIDKGGQLIAWLHGIQPFPLVVNEDPNGAGITPHRAGGQAWGGHSCPGDVRFGQYPALVLSALRYLDPNAAPTPEDDMPLTPDDVTAVALAVVNKLNEDSDRPGTTGIGTTLLAVDNTAAQILALVQALVAQPGRLTAVTDADLKAIAKAVNDEQAARLKS